MPALLWVSAVPGASVSRLGKRSDAFPYLNNGLLSDYARSFSTSRPERLGIRSFRSCLTKRAALPTSTGGSCVAHALAVTFCAPSQRLEVTDDQAGTIG